MFEKLLSSPDDIIDVTQENNADSNNVGYTLLNTSKISCKMIYNLLIHKDPRVILVENTKNTLQTAGVSLGILQSLMIKELW